MAIRPGNGEDAQPTIGGLTADQLMDRALARALEVANVASVRAGHDGVVTDYELPWVRVGATAGISATIAVLTDLGVPLQDPAKPLQDPRRRRCICPRIDVGTLGDESGSVTVPGTLDRDCPVHGLPKCTCGAAPFQPWHHPSCPRAL
jgi:hypothetical protein